jgi:glycine/D-amino acid oxidase-like deaminating enzyme
MAVSVVIVGGGIVGAACARALARAGADVTVVESRFPGGGATAAGMGHVVVMDDSPARLALTARSRELWQTLAAALPAAAEYRPSGTLWVAADADEMEEAVRKQSILTAAGIEARLLDPAALARAEPSLRPGLAGGLLVPGDAVVYPPPVAAWLLDEAARHGAKVHRESPAAAVMPAAGRGAEVRLADGARLRADVVLVAAGAASPQLVPGVPIRPRKGHLVITERMPGFLTHQVIELGYVKRAHDVGTDSVAFNVQPRATGQLLVGSSRQIDVESRDVDHAIVRRMLERCFEYMPGLARVPAIRTWTGFRAATPDGLPLVGPWPALPGVWLATGHEGLGITTSLGTAELVAHLLCGVDTCLDPLPCRPARFEAAIAAGGPHHG